MSKANFAGFNPGLPTTKDGPGNSVADSLRNSKEPFSSSPLVGCGHDARPEVKDNVRGNNRWPMGEGSPKDVSRAKISYKP